MNWDEYFDKIIINVIGFLNPTWSQTFIFVSIIFIYIFKTNIAKLLDRIKKVSREGITFVEAGESQSVIPPSTVEDVKTKTDTLFSNINSVPTIVEAEKILETGINEENKSDSEKIKLLIRELSTTFFILRCQIAYNSIFGSQIILLKKLNIAKPTGLNKENLDKFYNEIAGTYDYYENWTLNTYINFLLQAKLITQKEDYYFITVFGVDFLVWLQRVGLPENKAL